MVVLLGQEMVLKDRWKAREDELVGPVHRHKEIDAGASVSQRTGFPDRPIRVRFAEEHNVYLSSPPLTATDIVKRWYSMGDLHKLRMNRSRRIQAVLKEDQSGNESVTFQTLLVQAYQLCCSCLEDGKAARFSPDFFKSMVKQLQSCPERHGLETVGVPLVAMRQQMQRSEMRRSIRRIQEAGASTLPPERMQEFIRMTCESYSRSSTLYAGLIALAHAVAET